MTEDTISQSHVAWTGNAVAAAIRQSVLPDVQAFSARAGRPPGLGIVLVGDDPGSEIYVRNKVKAAASPGSASTSCGCRPTASLDELLALVHRVERRAQDHDGILVQAPLPAAMGRDASQRVFDAIDPAKDVDGFHPINVGRLVQGRAHLAPCTPSGVIEMLDYYGITIGGTRAVIIGRSEIVGKPMAMLLLRRDATVTICHSKTPALASVAAEADILVAAIGRAGIRDAGFREARRDGDRRRDQPGDGSRAGARSCSARHRRALADFDAAARWSWATCTRAWPTWQAR